ncbi:hypothetical protein HYG86_18020 [Alkalicella caledoniensis]|uniref:Uncharacterized protein n=1 Tax=Alkalicella caledoniensis TaxID=2731377 RepID=A0A7G9WCX2_ALKCA|nr:hypothetical protein [Alkalicella caledoniensis]QNO16534.1 hypothetical protein HYG86_18020 [Alkalicella caledoniensis]
MSVISNDNLQGILRELNNIKSAEVKNIKGAVENTTDLSTFLSDCQKKILYLDRAIQYYQGFLDAWKAYSSGEKVEDDDPIQRTTWVVHESIVTIAIRRPSSKYATTIRFSQELGQEMVDFILNFIDEKGFVRRSDILSRFEDKIIETTSYNSTSAGQVVYALTLLLLKEGVLSWSEHNKREYVRGINTTVSW